MRNRRFLLVAIVPFIISTAVAFGAFVVTSASPSSASHLQSTLTEPQDMASSTSGSGLVPSLGAADLLPTAPTWNSPLAPTSLGVVTPPAAEPISQGRGLTASLGSSDTLNLLLTNTRADSGEWTTDTVLSEQVAANSGSPRFWTTPLGSPAYAVVEVDGGRTISASPGPDDRVDVIVELKSEPVARARVRAQGLPSPGGAAAVAQEVHNQNQEVFNSHIAVLEEMADEGLTFKPKHYYTYIFNGIAGSVSMGDLSALADLSEVEKVHLDYEVHVTLADSVPLIGAPDVWSLQDSLGQSVTGHGVVVAIVDTGIDYTHADLGGCFGPSCRVKGGYDFSNNDTDPFDDMGHGTHVAGIVGASGASTGVAPDVSFLVYKVLGSGGSGSFSDVVAGIEAATDPDGDPTTDDAADIINMSLGGGGNPDDPVSQAVDNATALGVAVVISAGNNGSGYQTIGSPGVARTAITVGATDDNDIIAGFSSRGPVPSGWAIKPDVVAPGVSILAPVPIIGVLGDPSGYRRLSGTSMAAPHVAGAAALLKQMNPSWTPERIKVALMNTAEDLGYDVFTQGAGRIRVDRAVAAASAVAPGSLSLGLDDLTQSVWQTTKSLTITNDSESTGSYAVSFQHSLPVGVVLTSDVPSVTLSPGESTQVQISFTVDNTIVPDPPGEPSSYEGVVVVARSGDETLKVPFAFIKTPIINFTFDESPWIVWVHDRAGSSRFAYFPGTSLQLPFPAGTADAVVTYNDVSTRVFVEGISVGTAANVSVSKADAVHDVTISPVDIDGVPLSIQWGGERIEHVDSDTWLAIIFGFPTQRRFSDISDAYSWEWVAAQSQRSREPVYSYNGFANGGVTGDLVFQNQPSDLKHMSFSYSSPPGVENLQVRHWLSDGPVGAISMASYYGDLGNSLEKPFVRDEYYMPIPYPDFSFGYAFEEVFPFDATGDIAWDSQISRTPYLAARDNTRMEGFFLGEVDVPAMSTDSAQMPVGLGPPLWFGRFDNNESAIQLRAALGNPVWLFLDQVQGMRPHPNLTYELLRSGVLVETGDLEGVGDPWGGSSLVNIPAVSGDYTLKITYDGYYVANTGSRATLTAGFDTSAVDKDPPTLFGLNVLSSGGTPTDTIPPTALGRVRLEFTGDLPTLVTLRYSTGGGDETSMTWLDLAVVDEGSGDYTATLPVLPNNSYVSLSVYAEDSSGNSIHYRMIPAIAVALKAPGLISPTHGAAKRTGDVTFAWGTVETATDYRLQVDRVPTFDSVDLVEVVTTGTRHTATLGAKGVRHWRVLALDSQLNESPWSQVWRLTVADPVLQVTTHPGDDYAPALMEAADGKLWVAWYSCRSHCQVRYQTSPDGGATWSGETQLTSSNYNNYLPAIAQSSGGRVWATWDSYRDSDPSGRWNNDIWYRYSDDNGVTWSAEARLTTDTGDDYGPAMAEGPGGDMWAVWYSHRSGNADLWYKTGDGATWSPAIQLTTDTAYDYEPAIIRTTDGKMRIVWHRNSSIYYVTTPDGGATWSPETQLVACCNNYDPSIAETTGGRIWVAWESWRNLNPAGVWNSDVLYKYSDDGGATWSQEVPFTRFVGADNSPSVAGTSSGDLALAWASNRSGNYDIWLGVIGILEDVSPPPMIQSVAHRPYPNPDSDDVVTVTARPVDETGIAGVELVWSVNGVVTSDRAMYDDGQHGDGPPNDGTYGVQLGTFSVGTQVSYQVRATDTDGNVVLAPETANSFETLAPFVPASGVLLVLDDRNQSSYDRYYRDALDDMGVPFDYWDGSLRGYVDAATLAHYTGGAVIWAVPDNGFIGSSEAQDNLASYLDGGGNLFISLQYFWELGNTGFSRDYLHVSNTNWCVGVYDITGIGGDAIGDGLSFRIQGGDGANNQACHHVVTPVSPAAPVFSYVDLGGAPAVAPQAHTYTSQAPAYPAEPTKATYSPHDSPVLASSPEGLDPAGSESQVGAPEVGILNHIRSGTAALRVDTGTYKVVYFAFGFEAIDSRATREEVMRRVLGWLTLGTISGTVDLQWRTDHSGAQVSLAGTSLSTLSGQDGSFVLAGVPEGTYTVEVTYPTYLPARKYGVTAVRGEVTELPGLVLRGGDLNMDGVVDLMDLSALMLNFYMSESLWR